MAHILLAEDDESLRKFLAAALVKAGHAVTDEPDPVALGCGLGVALTPGKPLRTQQETFDELPLRETFSRPLPVFGGVIFLCLRILI